MKLKEIYELAVNLGIETDVRSKELIKKQLEQVNKSYEKLSDEEKKLFDLDKLTNPFADTRILVGDVNQEISGVLAGIDMEVSEILLADRLREKGTSIDLVLTHHPEGKALAWLHEVMGLQADLWHKYGVPINIGDALIDQRAREVQRALSPLNHNRAIDAAKLLGFAYMSVHTPADNLVSQFLQEYVDSQEPLYLDDVIKALNKIPEYESASRIGAGPRILVGDGRKRAGKIMVMMTGGTGGPEDSIEKLAAAGVGTLIEMHLDEKLRKKAEEHKLNIVIAGHIASDSIGMNLFLDQLEKRGLTVYTCSGLVRHKRAAA